MLDSTLRQQLQAIYRGEVTDPVQIRRVLSEASHTLDEQRVALDQDYSLLHDAERKFVTG